MSKFYDRFFLTFTLHGAIVLLEGGDQIYEIIKISLSIVLSYNLISYYFIKNKEKFISTKRSIFSNTKLLKNFQQRYFITVQEELNYLGNPYGLNITKYVFIKYILSIFLVILFAIQKRSFIQIILIFLILFFLPNVLILNYKKKESIHVINDLQSIINNMQISLATSNNLYDSLKFALLNVRYNRFKESFLDFVEEYKMYNYNVKKASKKLIDKFSQKELKTFVEILDDNKSCKNTLELLERFKEVTNRKEESALKNYYMKLNSYILCMSIIILILSFVLVIYPISIQILKSLNTILN